MFFHLFYNSHFFFSEDIDINQKLLKTCIYGTVLYIITHGFIHNLTNSTIIKNYFWILLLIDIISLGALFVMTNNGTTMFNLSNDISNELSDIKKITEYSPQVPQFNQVPQVSNIKHNISDPIKAPLQETNYVPLQVHLQEHVQVPLQEHVQEHVQEPIQIQQNEKSHYTDNKYKLSNNNMNEFEDFINTLQPEKTENKQKINLNLVKPENNYQSSNISEIKHNIENKTLEKVNSLKVESDLDFDLEEFNNSI